MELMSKLQETKDTADSEDNSKCLFKCVPLLKLNILMQFLSGKAAFKKRMKSHYKGEFNAAAVLRAKPDWEDEEDDDD